MSKKLAILIILLIFSGGFIYFFGFQKETVVVVEGTVSVTRTGGPTEISTLFYGMMVDVEAYFKDISALQYMTINKGPKVTESEPVEIPDVVNLTIIFRLTTPTNKTLEFKPLKLGKGGVHNFTLILGESEGIQGEGEFKLEIIFRLKVTTPVGTTVVDLEKVIIVYFELPEKAVRISE